MSSVKKPAKPGKSLEAFRAAHDKNFIVPNKIRAALEAMGSGWEYEPDFIKLAGISTTDMNMFRDQFAGHIVEVGSRGREKRVWAAKVSEASRMRELS